MGHGKAEVSVVSTPASWARRLRIVCRPAAPRFGFQGMVSRAEFFKIMDRAGTDHRPRRGRHYCSCLEARPEQLKHLQEIDLLVN